MPIPNICLSQSGPFPETTLAGPPDNMIADGILAKSASAFM